MGPERVEAIRYAGMLHDVGKLGVPTKVLQKDGPLTEEEFAAIQLHPMRGLEIVRGIDFLDEAFAGIMHHHERHDGTRLPDGAGRRRDPRVRPDHRGGRRLRLDDLRPLLPAAPARSRWPSTSCARARARQFDPVMVDGVHQGARARRLGAAAPRSIAPPTDAAETAEQGPRRPDHAASRWRSETMSGSDRESGAWQSLDSGQLLLICGRRAGGRGRRGAHGRRRAATGPRSRSAFGALIALGELVRLTMPGNREVAPIGAAAALGYALLLDMGGTPASRHTALQVVAVHRGRHDRRRAAAPGGRPPAAARRDGAPAAHRRAASPSPSGRSPDRSSHLAMDPATGGPRSA